MEINDILQSIRGRCIVVVGDVMLDHYVWGDAQRISPEAPVPVVDVMRDSYAPGGAANVALNLASLGAQPVLFGKVGEDDAGKILMDLLRERKVDTSGIVFSSACQTIRKTRVMVRSQQLCRVDREDSPTRYALHEDSAVRDQLKSFVSDRGEGVLLSDYGKGGITDELFAYLRDMCQQKKIPLALDPKPRRKLTFTNVDLLTPNRPEALQLAGLSTSVSESFPGEVVCQKIWERHKPEHLAITLGADGILLSVKGRILAKIPTFAQEVFDVSGAGDTVIAALLLAQLAGADLKLAGHFANLAAGIVVGRVGTTTATPEEIREEARRHSLRT